MFHSGDGSSPKFQVEARFAGHAKIRGPLKVYEDNTPRTNTPHSARGRGGLFCCVETLEWQFTVGALPRISITLEGGNVTITFQGTLQSAPSVIGPWTDVPAGSPYTTVASGVERFFRFRQ